MAEWLSVITWTTTPSAATPTNAVASLILTWNTGKRGENTMKGEHRSSSTDLTSGAQRAHKENKWMIEENRPSIRVHGPRQQHNHTGCILKDITQHQHTQSHQHLPPYDGPQGAEIKHTSFFNPGCPFTTNSRGSPTSSATPLYRLSSLLPSLCDHINSSHASMWGGRGLWPMNRNQEITSSVIATYLLSSMMGLFQTS